MSHLVVSRDKANGGVLGSVAATRPEDVPALVRSLARRVAGTGGRSVRTRRGRGGG